MHDSNLYKKYLFHKHAVMLGFTVTMVLMALFSPYAFQAVLFSTIAMMVFLINLSIHKKFVGYGVASRMQEILEAKGVSEIKINAPEQVLSGTLVKPLARYWIANFVGTLVIGPVFILLTSTDPKSNPQLIPFMLTVNIFLLSAFYTGICAAIYVWFAADRQRMWYMPASLLKTACEQVNLPRETREKVFATARNEKLLIE
jgi:hypothetical protein